MIPKGRFDKMDDVTSFALVVQSVKVPSIISSSCLLDYSIDSDRQAHYAKGEAEEECARTREL